jgi:hypothetical protein
MKLLYAHLLVIYYTRNMQARSSYHLLKVLIRSNATSFFSAMEERERGTYKCLNACLDVDCVHGIHN